MADSSVLTIAAWNALVTQVNTLASTPPGGDSTGSTGSCPPISTTLLPVVDPHRWSVGDITAMQGVLTQMCSSNVFTTPVGPQYLWLQQILDEINTAIAAGWCNQCSGCPKCTGLIYVGYQDYVIDYIFEGNGGPQPRNFSIINGISAPCAKCTQWMLYQYTFYFNGATDYPGTQVASGPVVAGKVSGCSYQADISAYGFWQDISCCATPHNPYNGSDGVFDFNDCGLNCEEWYSFYYPMFPQNYGLPTPPNQPNCEWYLKFK